MHRFNQSAKKSRDFNKHFTCIYLQFVAKIESENDSDTNSKDELSNAFAALLAGIIEEEIKETGKQHLSSYFTLVKSFFLTKSLIVFYIIFYVKTLLNNFNN